MNIAHYAKFIVLALTATVAGLIAALTDNVLTPTEVIGVAVVFLGALGVYLVPNLPVGPGRYAKLFVTGAVAAAVVLTSALIDNGISLSEWLQIILAFAGAVGVYVLPNEPSTDVYNYVTYDQHDVVAERMLN